MKKLLFLCVLCITSVFPTISHAIVDQGGDGTGSSCPDGWVLCTTTGGQCCAPRQSQCDAYCGSGGGSGGGTGTGPSTGGGSGGTCQTATACLDGGNVSMRNCNSVGCVRYGDGIDRATCSACASGYDRKASTISLGSPCTNYTVTIYTCEAKCSRPSYCNGSAGTKNYGAYSCRLTYTWDQATCTCGTTTSSCYCNSGYFGANSSCTKCPDDYPSGGGSRIYNCYKSCTKACTQQTCPSNATCSHGSSSTSGTHYYGGSCDAPASTCSISVSCDAGYYGSTSCSSCTGVGATDLSQGCDRNPTSTELSNVHAYAGTISGATQQCTGNHTTGPKGATNASQCTGCSAWGSCTGGTLTITSCAAGYYKNDDGGCSGCPSDYPNSADGNTSGIGACYRSCTKACTQQTCPSSAYSCTHGNTSTSGTQYYGGTCSAAASTCSLTINSCKAGYYKDGNSCKECPSGYTSDNGTTGGIGSCYMSVPAGKYVKNAHDSSASTCVAGTSKAAHTVYYGNTSSCAVCDTNTYSNAGAGSCTPCNTAKGYTNSGSAAANHAGVTSCKTTCAAGTRVVNANEACSTPSGNTWYTGEHTVSQTQISPYSTCPTGYTTRGSTAAYHDAKSDCKIDCDAGTQVAAADAVCTTPNSSNWYTEDHTVSATATSSSSGYVKSCNTTNKYYNSGSAAANHAGVTSCKTTCAAGTRVVNANEACSTPSGNTWYTGEHTVSQTQISPYSTCPTGYTTRGSTAAYHDAKSDCKIDCDAGTQVAAADAVCTTPNSSNWYTEDHTVSATATSSSSGYVKSCNTTNKYYNSGSAAANHANITSCIVTCPDTTYVAEPEGACITIGTGYYRSQHTVRQTLTSEDEGTPRNLCPGRYIDGAPVAIEDDCISNCTTGDVPFTTAVEGIINYSYEKYGASDNRAIYTCAATLCEVDHYLLENGSPNNLASCPACVRYATCAGGDEWFVCDRPGYHLSDDNYDNLTICNPDEYTITLNKNGGFGMVLGVDGTADATMTCLHGVPCYLPPSKHTPDEEELFDLRRDESEAWAFAGWGYAPTCDNGQYHISVNNPGTLYACWIRESVPCKLGQFYNAGKFQECQSGYYCTGDGVSPVDEIGCRTECPLGASGSDLGASDNRRCYYICPVRTLDGGTATNNQERVYFDGVEYPECTYDVSCAAGYVAYGRGTASATCIKCSDGQNCPGGNEEGTPSECPVGSYCTDGIAKQCPDNGTSPRGSKYITDCYKDNLPYVTQHGEGTQTCNYSDTSGKYDATCTNKVINICQAGYWLPSSQVINPECSEVGNGYYSDGTKTTRDQCPGFDAQTDTRTSTDIKDCYRSGLEYYAQHGTGTQRCYYTSGTGTGAVYDRDCDTKRISRCDGGYWLSRPTDSECISAGMNYYSGMDELERHACPGGGLTHTETESSVSSCYKDGLTYPDSRHGSGYYTCYHTSGMGEDAEYSTKCGLPTIVRCDAGYYYDQFILQNDCIVVDYGYYSPEDELVRYLCPRYGLTDTDTSGSVTACYRTDMSCEIENGSGEQTCNYSEDDQEYTAYCQTCYVTGCDLGYSQLGDTECIMCPADHVCHDKIMETCSSMTGGVYEYSDEGTMDVSLCYKACDLDTAGHAAEMRGRDYKDFTDTCEIARCEPGYTLQDGKCELCPEGSYCDGLVTPVNPGDDIKSCSDLGGKWIYSAAGSDSATDCYRVCEDYDIEYGTAIRINDTEQYPDECQYRGESVTGNPCEIIDGKCVETGCKYNYEMIDGVCQLCNREHALSYHKTGNCLIASCEPGYHPNGRECEWDIKDCTSSGTHVKYAEQVWDYGLQSYGRCIIKECEEGYHLESNACVPDTTKCTIEHGSGIKEWDSSRGTWGECIATSCIPGYTSDPSEMYEHNAQCGECRNKYGVLGEVAVSSYVSGCEIASCMYQGEIYALENNECVPICPTEAYTDETGTIQRIGNRCVTTCAPGYIPW